MVQEHSAGRLSYPQLLEVLSYALGQTDGFGVQVFQLDVVRTPLILQWSAIKKASSIFLENRR